eukprot:EG_transcript_27178
MVESGLKSQKQPNLGGMGCTWDPQSAVAAVHKRLSGIRVHAGAVVHHLDVGQHGSRKFTLGWATSIFARCGGAPSGCGTARVAQIHVGVGHIDLCPVRWCTIWMWDSTGRANSRWGGPHRSLPGAVVHHLDVGQHGSRKFTLGWATSIFARCGGAPSGCGTARVAQIHVG